MSLSLAIRFVMKHNSMETSHDIYLLQDVSPLYNVYAMLQYCLHNALMVLISVYIMH